MRSTSMSQTDIDTLIEAMRLFKERFHTSNYILEEVEKIIKELNDDKRNTKKTRRSTNK